MKRRIVCILLTVVLLMSSILVPASAASHPFTDVKDKDWFSEAVEWVYANGCMNGTSATRFSPNQGMTRAMLVTVLWRMDGGWRPLNGVPFEDIEPDAYYTEAVKWTYSKHIVNGTSLTTFSPNQNVTREQLVAIIYRYAIFKRLDVTGRADLNQFPDAGKVAEYARDPFSWAIDAGIINGTDGKLAPQGRALRCQAAAILQRFDAWQQEHPAAPEPELPGPTEPEPTEHTHSYTASVTTPATCTEAGVMTYTCSCGDSYTEAIPAAGHSWETVHHDEIGHWLSVAKCNCGYTFSTTKGSELAYLFDAHVNEFPRSEISEHIGYVNWDEWIIDVPAYDEWVCTVCGETSDTQP